MIELEERADHYWVTYMYPMRLIKKNDEIVSFSLDEINECSYNHGILCRIVGDIENSFNGNLVRYIICGDGAVAIDVSSEFSENDLLLNYNDLFCKLMLGGIDIDCISTRDLTTGNLYGQKSIWPVSFGYSYNSHLHANLRMRITNNVDAIVLEGASTNALSIDELKLRLQGGSEIIDRINNLSTYHLIVGVTEIKYGNWSAAVSNLWIVAEQLTDYLWERDFVNNEDRDPDIPTRKQTLRQDHRTFSTSVKQEILFQIGVLPLDTYSDIYSVRKARNKLIHEGKMASKSDACKLYRAVNTLIGKAGKCTQDTVLPELSRNNRLFRTDVAM